MAELKIGNREMVGISALLVLSLFSLLFGFTGFRLIVGFFLLFFLPAYLILSLTGIETEEKIALSAVFGIVLMPSIVYWPALYFSLRVVVLMAFFVLMLVWFVLKKYKNRRRSDKS